MRNLMMCMLILGSAPALAQPTFTSTQLTKDFAIFRTALEEAHPGLYRYRTKQEMDRYFDEAKSSIKDGMNAFDFYRVLAPVVSALGCGHTACSLPLQIAKDEQMGELKLPFDLRFVGDKTFIIKNYSDDPDFAPGTEIISIDGKPIKAFSDQLVKSVFGDGFIQTSRRAKLERQLGRYLRLLYKNAKDFQFGLLSQGKLKEKKVTLLVLPAPINKPGLEYQSIDKSTGLLTIRSFGGNVASAEGKQYKEFLAEVFARIKKDQLSKLIIDLRGNGGGNDDYGSLLFGYLTTKPFEYYNYLEMNKPEFSFLQYTDVDASRVQRMQEILDVKDGRYYYKKTAHPCLPTQQPQADHFDGKVIVLTDGLSFSATAEFSSIAWFKQRATFVGEETGGAYEGNTSGGGTQVTLPETKTRVDIPFTKYECAVTLDPKLKGRGIIPHRIVTPTLEGLLAGKDEVLEVAKGM